MENEHYIQVCALLDTFDEGCQYANDYNALPHDYNGITLYQAEAQFIKKIGNNPGITITELSEYFGKTKSACSQLMYRMKKKGFLLQKRNEHNNREYNLYLSEDGEHLYQSHKIFEEKCYHRTAEMLNIFSKSELDTYQRIQKKMNESFLLDVLESKELDQKLSKSSTES